MILTYEHWMRVLVVEDEKKVASFIRKGLAEQSYSVDVATDGLQGQLLARQNEYDLIILDVLLPKQDGWTTCKKIREDGVAAPIMMLTALADTPDKVKGLDAGADDYVTKPFELEEFLARVRALLRRTSPEKKAVLKIGDLVLNPAEHSVVREGKALRLTAKEFALLEFMMRSRGRVLTRAQISEHVWDMDFDPASNVVDAYIKLLRQKVDKGFTSNLIHTVIGVGYVLREEHPI